jgi:uridylate kinase
LYNHITFADVLAKNLGVMDSTAGALCKDNNVKIVVFNMNKDGNIVKAMKGDSIGTLVDNN